MNRLNPVRAIAVIEGLKGLSVIVVGFGLLSLIHRNVQAFAEAIVGHLHLNAAKDIPRIFLEYSAELTNQRLAVLASLAFVYAAGRLIEAYGLWYERKWAEWFAVVTATIYVPFELAGIVDGRILGGAIALFVNLAVLAIMAQALRRGPAGLE